MKFRPRLRFSLQTLLIVALLLGSSGLLWRNWNPWVLRRRFPAYRFDYAIETSSDGRKLILFQNIGEQRDNVVEVKRGPVHIIDLETLSDHALPDSNFELSPDNRTILTR